MATFGCVDLNWNIFVKHVKKPSIEEATPVLQVDVELCWVDLLVDFITTETLPVDLVEVQKVKRQAPWYVCLDRKLFRRSFTLHVSGCPRPTTLFEKFTKEYAGIT